MPSSARRAPDEFVGYTIVRVAHVLQRKMDEALQPLGLNARQFSALVLLAENPKISGGQLARLVLVTPQSVSDLVGSLVAAGLVRRAPSEGRGRAMPMSLTPAGRGVLGRAFALVEQLEQSTLAHLGPAEATRLNQTLQSILAALSPAEAERSE